MDGHDVFVGARFADTIDSAALISFSNDNTLYRLFLYENKPVQQPYDPPSLVLVLGDKSLRFLCGGGGPTQRDWNTDLTDPVFIVRAANFFKIAPLKRTDPGNHFTTAFVTNPRGYPVSDPIQVAMEISNTGTTPFSMYSNIWDNIEQSAGPFTFTPVGQQAGVRQLDRIPSMGGITVVWTLRPGDKRSFPVNLNLYLAFDKPGTYRIRGVCSFDDINPDIKKTFPPLWNETASAEFRVTIK